MLVFFLTQNLLCARHWATIKIWNPLERKLVLECQLRPWVQSKIKDRTLRFRPRKTNVCWAPPADRGSKSQMRQKTRKEFIVIEFFVREGRGKEPKGHRPHSRTRFGVESSGEVSVHEEMGILWGRRERWSTESWRKIVRMFQKSQS